MAKHARLVSIALVASLFAALLTSVLTSGASAQVAGAPAPDVQPMFTMVQPTLPEDIVQVNVFISTQAQEPDFQSLTFAADCVARDEQIERLAVPGDFVRGEVYLSATIEFEVLPGGTCDVELRDAPPDWSTFQNTTLVRDVRSGEPVSWGLRHISQFSATINLRIDVYGASDRIGELGTDVHASVGLDCGEYPDEVLIVRNGTGGSQFLTGLVEDDGTNFRVSLFASRETWGSSCSAWPIANSRSGASFSGGGTVQMTPRETSTLNFVARFHPAESFQCRGLEATIIGTPDDDVLTGTHGADVIYADAGNDIVRGGGGADVICGGEGDDRLWGNAGKDTLLGGAGDDVLRGGRGSDVLAGGAGNDVADGAIHTDRCKAEFVRRCEATQ